MSLSKKEKVNRRGLEFDEINTDNFMIKRKGDDGYGNPEYLGFQESYNNDSIPTPVPRSMEGGILHEPLKKHIRGSQDYWNARGMVVEGSYNFAKHVLGDFENLDLSVNENGYSVMLDGTEVELNKNTEWFIKQTLLNFPTAKKIHLGTIGDYTHLAVGYADTTK